MELAADGVRPPAQDRLADQGVVDGEVDREANLQVGEGAAMYYMGFGIVVPEYRRPGSPPPLPNPM